MANYYYVKNGGTATGDAGRVATTPSTGSFATKGASAYYDSISAALATTTAPASGDFIYCSDAHDKNYGATTANAIPDGVTVVSVSDTNCDQYSAGAKETSDITGFYDYTISIGNTGYLCGMHFSANDDTFLNVGNMETLYAKDLKATMQRNGCSLVFSTTDGGTVYVDGLEFVSANADNIISIQRGIVAHINNLHGSGTGVDNIFTLGSNGGAALYVSNSDLTGFATTTASLSNALTAGKDTVKLTLTRCKLPSSYSVFPSAPTVAGYEVDIIGCDAGDGYHYFHHMRPNGEVIESTTTYLNATYDGINGFSAEMNPSADCTIGSPLRHKLYEIPAQDLTASKTVTVELTCASTLTDTEFWVEVVHPDLTDNALGVTKSSRNTDILAAGTTLTTSSETWTAGKTNTYKVDVVVPALTGVDNGTLEVYVNLACDGVTLKDVWVDPAVSIA